MNHNFNSPKTIRCPKHKKEASSKSFLFQWPNRRSNSTVWQTPSCSVCTATHCNRTAVMGKNQNCISNTSHSYPIGQTQCYHENGASHHHNGAQYQQVIGDNSSRNGYENGLWLGKPLKSEYNLEVLFTKSVNSRMLVGRVRANNRG